MKIIVTAGGTGGHIYPALAIIDKFKEKEKNLEVLYIGTHNRMEKKIVPEKKIKYEALKIYGLSKTDMIRNFKNLFLIIKATKKCESIIKTFKPDIVIGCGGYVTYPVLKAAKKLGVKTFIHEQNSKPGKANVALSKNVDLVGITFKDSEKYFEKSKKVVYTGHPCASSALKVKPANKKDFNLNKSQKLVTITAGSLGSESLNKIIIEYLKNIKEKKYSIIFVTGKAHYDDVAKNKFPDNVKIIPYYDPLTSIMKISDIIISRAGAGTLAEIVALKIPTIIIPSPYVANNHQYYNALDLKENGACELIEEKNINAKLLTEKIEELLFNKEKYLAMKNAQEKMKIENSSELIYNLIKEVTKC